MRPRHLTSAALALALAASTLTATVLSASPAAASHAAAAAAPDVHAKLVKGGLNDPAGFTFTPKGWIYYAERGTGEIHVLNPSTGKGHLFFKVRGVNGSGERGALGVALDPSWPRAPFVYVYATRSTHGGLRNQVLRIRSKGGKGVGFRVIAQAPASSSPYHNGGRILFGRDGKLYVFIGDGHDSTNAQDRTANLQGKMLRINPDGSVPSDNPFAHSPIWSYGNRNSYGFTFDPKTHRLWQTENGPECNDEINVITKGGNFGWGPNETCSGTSPGNTNNSGPAPRHRPKVFFGATIAITGAAFCHRCGLGPRWEGKLFFGCVNDGKLRVLALNVARTGPRGSPNVVLDSPGGAIYSMETAPNGTIYFSDSGGIYKLTR